MPEQLTFRSALKFGLIVVLLLCVVLYTLFQARYLIIGPQIVLENEPHFRHNDRQIFLEGTAFNISRLWLNDRQIYTDGTGNFKEALILENGYTVATLRAEDRYGRQTTIERSYVYSPTSFIQ